MKRVSFILLFFLSLFSATAQTQSDTLNGWKHFGKFSILFNQAAFNAEWQNGGTSSYGGNALVDYNFNYRKNKFTWDNKFTAEYGLTKTDDSDFSRKTVDRVEFNSLAGKQIQESNWYLSLFLNFKTQFAPGYEYSEDDLTGETIRTETTHAFSPAYIQFGPGILWKESDNLKVNIAPATSRLIIVDEEFTSFPGYIDGDYFGVEPGESTRYEFGASVNAYAKFILLENVSMENILSLYSNYLEDPKNVDVDYTMNLVMKVNDFLSANFLFQAIYDDNAVQAVQVREVLGVGFTYVFGE